MNSPYTLDAGMDVDLGLDLDLHALLAPLPGGDGVGDSLRADPVYRLIRDARHQDDPSLPMGEWERPLIKANWKAVAALCSEALQTRSKDFQLAAWLCEAWTHLHGIDGLVAGTQLLTGLAERYWDAAYPQLEEADTDARAAPFVWLNQTLALALSLNVPLMAIDGREPAALSLDEYQRAIATSGAEEDGVLTRELLEQHVVRTGNLAELARLRDSLVVARDVWHSFSRLIDLRLDANAPSFAPVADALAHLFRAATGLIGEHAVPVLPVSNALASSPIQIEEEAAVMLHAPARTHAFAQMPMPATGAVASLTGMIVDRSHAYRLLEDIADYLARHEPHSPTPYLLKRALSWGPMSLAELMRDIGRKEGDMAAYLSMLGLE
ncbi:type VI secretion system protein TssA [Caballeronia sp. SEWSISQ10-4 2]|uniref:type VI secretion system protein TssA n=1 Tax=Caballeronia sp. SEWSISQ10-4 2 TaxID=2937438 RepID=UPI00265049FD|nr:type VI secretion system protein TssA [Caballeronia sp. SEWSISQ10-4 2]MDN7179005.1 type VI secretion system protein TssA [Caballeronia sp. SEWSISQ10-4 2]